MDSNKIILIIFTLLETLLFGGLLQGWSSLVYVLKEAEIFEELCEDEKNRGNNTGLSVESNLNSDFENATHICEEQESRLHLIFSIAYALGIISVVVIGAVDNKIGTEKTRVVFMMLFMMGSVCIAFTSKDLPWLILPGIQFVAIGGFSLLLTNVRVSFTLKYGSTIYLALLTGLYNSTAIIQWLVKFLYEHGIHMQYSYIGISVCHVIVSSVTTYLHPSSESDKQRSIKQDQKDEPVEEYMIDIQGNQTARVRSMLTVKDVEGNKNFENDHNSFDSQGSTVQITSIKSIIFTPMFNIHMCWFCLVTLRYFYFIGSINYRLEFFLRNKILVGHFTDVFAYVMLGGIVMSFVVGALYEWQKQYFKAKGVLDSRFYPHVLPMCVCSGLSILISALELSREAYILYINFILIVILRAFVFPVNMAFIAAVYPPRHVTFIVGLTTAVSGVFSFLQYALFSWNKSYEMAPYHVSGCLLALGILTLGHPINIYRHVYRLKH